MCQVGHLLDLFLPLFMTYLFWNSSYLRLCIISFTIPATPGVLYFLIDLYGISNLYFSTKIRKVTYNSRHLLVTLYSNKPDSYDEYVNHYKLLSTQRCLCLLCVGPLHDINYTIWKSTPTWFTLRGWRMSPVHMSTYPESHLITTLVFEGWSITGSKRNPWQKNGSSHGCTEDSSLEFDSYLGRHFKL